MPSEKEWKKKRENSHLEKSQVWNYNKNIKCVILIETEGGVYMKKTVFKGVATALITPFKENGEVDFAALERIINWQIDEGINGLVICGTTGEKATLNDQEHCEVLRRAVEFTRGRVPIIAGTGSNDTAHAIWMTREAYKLGCDAALVCTPYYNKTTQEGLVEMYRAIADESELPIIVYNVPSRTGIAIEPETYKVIAEHPMICGIKEANGDLSKIAQTFNLLGDGVAMYSGNDDQVIPIMSLGGLGVISVLSNVCPALTVKMTDFALQGNFKEAAELQLKLIPFINALFSEVNPIPVKAAMSELGFCLNKLRLPLIPMSALKHQKMKEIMKDLGLI